MATEVITFAELRQSISRRPPWYDLLALGTLDSATSSTAVDADEFTFTADNALNGAWIHVFEGFGLNQERYINDFTASSDTAAVEPNWTTTPDATSKYEIHRKARVADYNEAIKAALRIDRRYHTIQVLDDSLTGVASQREYVLPPGFAYIHEIAYLPAANLLTNEVKLDPWDWEYLYNGKLRFRHVIPATAAIRIKGTKYSVIPVNDDDILGVNIELITLYVLSILDVGNHDRWASEHIKYRDDLAVDYPANSVPIELQ